MQTAIRFAMLLLCWVASVSAATPPCELRVGWEEWYPVFHEKEGQLQGSEYERVSALAAKAGCRLRFLEMPWTRSMQELKGGGLDMLYGASKTPERESFAAFSPSYRVEQIVLVVRSGENEKVTKVSLQKWLAQPTPKGRLPILGLALGYYYGTELEAIIRSPKLTAKPVEVRWDQTLHQMLEFDRIDGFMAEITVARTMLATDAQKFKLLSLTEHKPEPLHLMFSRTVDRAVIERFAKAIREMPARKVR